MARYRSLEEHSAARLDALLWTGEYYRQLLDDVDAHAYQYGEGCLSDQLLGQLQAHVAGLGYVLPPRPCPPGSSVDLPVQLPASTRHARESAAHLCTAGRVRPLMCTWPRGGEPRWPFVYSDEVWSGTEYQVATNLVYEGEVAKALDIVAACRARYDGYRRNPWDEVECGHHYARSMASWALLPALSWLPVRRRSPGAHLQAGDRRRSLQHVVHLWRWVGRLHAVDGRGRRDAGKDRGAGREPRRLHRRCARSTVDYRGWPAARGPRAQAPLLITWT